MPCRQRPADRKALLHKALCGYIAYTVHRAYTYLGPLMKAFVIEGPGRLVVSVPQSSKVAFTAA